MNCDRGEEEEEIGEEVGVAYVTRFEISADKEKAKVLNISK